MAHEIDMTNDRANFAFTGSRSAIWHGLGQEIPDTSSIEEWIKAAGLGWKVKSADVMFNAQSMKSFDDRVVLYRSDNEAPLSIVSKDFKVVQPREVIEFFKDLVESHNMKLSTAGSLFGGKRFWALAELGKDFEVVTGDKVTGNLLLTTAVDGSLNTTAKFVSTRVVCNNTLTIAMGEKGKNLVKVSHRSQWDPTQVKMDLGLIDQSWITFMENCKKMASIKIDDQTAAKFMSDLIIGDIQDEIKNAQKRKIDNLMSLYEHGAGADMSHGTLWGAVNAITEMFTHGSGRRDASHQFWDAFYANGSNIKEQAFEKALLMAA